MPKRPAEILATSTCCRRSLLAQQMGLHTDDCTGDPARIAATKHRRKVRKIAKASRRANRPGR